MKNALLSFCFLLSFLPLSAQDAFFFNILSPPDIQASYPNTELGSGDEAWGWNGIITNDIVGELVYAETDENDVQSFCEANAVDYTGQIVLIDRGECQFSEKALNAQNQGAVAVIIRNNVSDGVLTMGVGIAGEQVIIPVVMISMEMGDPIISKLAQGETIVASFSLTAQAGTYVSGKVIQDDNDCIENDPLVGQAGFKIQVANDVFSKTVFANGSGEYLASLIPGDYSINSESISPYWESCPDQLISIEENDQLELNLLSNVESFCPYLTLDLTIFRLRRCFDNNLIFIDFCNVGTDLAQSAVVQLSLPSLVSIVNSNTDFAAIGNNIFEFQVGDLDIGDCGLILLDVLLSCDAELGQTLCAAAEISPNGPCIGLTAPWDNVDVRAQASCNNDVATLSLSNLGSEAMPTASTYRILLNESIIKTGSFQLSSGESTSFEYNGNGGTYRIESDALPLTPMATAPSDAIEACSPSGGSGDSDFGFINQYPTADYGDFYDEDCIEVIGSFDPNDKQANILGYGPSHYIEQNISLEYKIRFQNTGTDTAFTVVLLDTLSQWLDPASLRPIGASHAYEVFLNNNILEVNFPDILLPDSVVNEPGSNGYFTFRIDQKVNVPLESVINNRAGIYFDFNEPVITNTVMHTVGKDFIPLILATEQIGNYEGIEVFPNPASDQCYVQLKNRSWSGSRMVLYDQLGQQLRVYTLNDELTILPIDQLNSGAYHYLIEKEGMNKLAGRLIIVN